MVAVMNWPYPAPPDPIHYNAFWRPVSQRDEKDTTLNCIDDTEVGFETVVPGVEQGTKSYFGAVPHHGKTVCDFFIHFQVYVKVHFLFPNSECFIWKKIVRAFEITWDWFGEKKMYQRFFYVRVDRFRPDFTLKMEPE